jgi:light-regulated signal transduction histidine kinase (bacteriophytochrome)
MTYGPKGAHQFDAIVTSYLQCCFDLHHDLNNPLAAILGYCQFLLDDGETLRADQKSNVEQIRACAMRIQGIVDQLAHERSVLVERMAAASGKASGEKTKAAD